MLLHLTGYSVTFRLLDSFTLNTEALSIPVAERSEARVCGRSLTGVAGSNLAGDMDVCVECLVQ